MMTSYPRQHIAIVTITTNIASKKFSLTSSVPMCNGIDRNLLFPSLFIVSLEKAYYSFEG